MINGYRGPRSRLPDGGMVYGSVFQGQFEAAELTMAMVDSGEVRHGRSWEALVDKPPPGSGG